MLMLKSIFNEKAQYQKEVDFHYSVRGDIEENIGHIATNNFQEHHSKKHRNTKEEKHSRHLIDILHWQQVLAELKEHIVIIDEIIEQMEANNRLIREGFRLLETDDISGMRELLSQKVNDTHLLDDDEVRIEVQGLIGRTINSQQDLQDTLEKELIKFEENVERLDHNSEEYHQHKAQLDLRRSRLEQIAAEQQLNYERAEKELRIYGNNYSALKDENNNIRYYKNETKNVSDNELTIQLQEDRENDPSQRITKPLFLSTDLN